MQEPVYVLHLITCHGRIMPSLAKLLLKFYVQFKCNGFASLCTEVMILTCLLLLSICFNPFMPSIP